jgi:hypothetical protein
MKQTSEVFPDRMSQLKELAEIKLEDQFKDTHEELFDVFPDEINHKNKEAYATEAEDLLKDTFKKLFDVIKAPRPLDPGISKDKNIVVFVEKETNDEPQDAEYQAKAKTS